MPHRSSGASVLLNTVFGRFVTIADIGRGPEVIVSSGAGSQGAVQFSEPLERLNVTNPGPLGSLPGFEPLQTLVPGMTSWSMAFDGPSRFYMADNRLTTQSNLDRYDNVGGLWRRTTTWQAWSNPPETCWTVAGRNEGGSYHVYGASGRSIFRWDTVGNVTTRLFTVPDASVILYGVALPPVDSSLIQASW